MFRKLIFAALGLAAAMIAAPVVAETTPAPPNWQDGRGASVYLGTTQQTQAGTSNGEANRYSVGTQPPPTSTAPPRIDSAVVPAVHQEPAAANVAPARRLAPPRNLDEKPSDQNGRTGAGARRLGDFGLPVQSIYTVITALAIVIGAFLLFAWALRRSNRNAGARRGIVPTDAVSVLGRVPLAARQFAELLRVGNKLVLVAQTPNGPTTLTEVTDPVEVDRLVGMCQQFDPHSTTKAFEQVFQQFSSEPAGSGFLGGDPLPTSLSSAALAYRSQRGASRA